VEAMFGASPPASIPTTYITSIFPRHCHHRIRNKSSGNKLLWMTSDMSEAAIAHDYDRNDHDSDEKNKCVQQLKALIHHVVVPMIVAVIIGVFSFVEILETLPDISNEIQQQAGWWAIHKHSKETVGHAHGMVMLAIIRMTRSISILYTQLDEIREGMHGVRSQQKQSKQSVYSLSSGASQFRHFPLAFMTKISNEVGRFFFSPAVTIVVCLLAVFASAVEVCADLRPGAHHGCCLLGLSELNFQWHRLQQRREHHHPHHHHQNSDTSKQTSTTGTVEEVTSNTSDSMKSSQPRAGKWGFRRPPAIRRQVFCLRSVVALAAAIFAVMEIVKDFAAVGSHHGVCVLAAAECVENVYRSRLF
jgi:hypothetical protein